jgi:CDP-diacylglycerol---glycerol-3-phosphate 3-phosphatidyltransferase
MDAPQATSKILNVPNSLSVVRLLLALVVGLLIESGRFLPAMVVFIIAAGTDAVDGWWARRFHQVTKLGRVLDPFVDKIIITAALVALVGAAGSHVQAWMVTLIIGREFLVTSIRAMVEGKGGDFSARWLGKLKMVFQCAAVVACLLTLHLRAEHSGVMWVTWVTIVLLWSAIAITLASGVDYVLQAIKISRTAV